MIRFIKPLAALLAISFSATGVRGQNNGCITGPTSRCTPATAILDLEDCVITDNDVDDLNACFDAIGRDSITNILMEGNALTTIPAGLFGDLTMMVKLDLRANAIATIEVGAFENLPALQELNLPFNMISTIPAGMFANLSALLILNLAGNKIETIQAGSFAGVWMLTRLQLEGNLLETLPANVFAGLTVMTRLNLQRNQIKIIEDGVFTDLIAVTDMNLEQNQLETLQTDVFAGMVALEDLNIQENAITTIEANAFAGLPALDDLYLQENMIATIDADVFAGLFALTDLDLEDNMIETIDPNAFADLSIIEVICLDGNKLKTIDADLFAGLDTLEILYLSDNLLEKIPDGSFDDLVALRSLYLHQNQLTTVPSNIFAELGSLGRLTLRENLLEKLPADAFSGLSTLTQLQLQDNALTTLPAGLLEDVGSGTSLTEVDLGGNTGLQCVPTVFPSTLALPSTPGLCGCTPAEAVCCDAGMKCATGAVGYTCVVAVDCVDDTDCDTGDGEVCCPLTNICEIRDQVEPGACGDPHMTGFRGQKFDFTGVDRGWYAVVSDLPHMHLNMRVTSPVPSVPEITYITGISIVTQDADGFDHSIVISVDDPHNMASSCPVGTSPCLADGALHVVVNGDEVLISPGEVTVAPGVAIAAANLPGACRSFGFENYWEAKKLERLAQAGRRLISTKTMQSMSDWIISDPTATNKVECEAYVASATEVGGVGLFAKQSEHTSFQIMTPAATIRLSHGRLHQLPMRDPSDQFDLPDHLAWQMNMAIDHSQMGLDATGILGETLVPTVDHSGAPIMKGMDAIRGQQEDYRVSGPLGLVFPQSKRHE